jgi:hypothetical protein
MTKTHFLVKRTRLSWPERNEFQKGLGLHSIACPRCDTSREAATISNKFSDCGITKNAYESNLGQISKVSLVRP